MDASRLVAALWDGWSLSDLVKGGMAEPLIFATVTGSALYGYSRLAARRSLLRRLLPFKKSTIRGLPPTLHSAQITVAYALIPPEKIGLPYFMVEEGDVRCLYLVHSLVTDIYGRRNVSALDEADVHASAHLHRNLAIISGPVWNKTMELYTGLAGSPVRIEWDGDDLKLAADGVEYRTGYVGQHRVKTCHGMIVAARIAVAGKEQRVLMVAGCSNLSTYAGAILLSQLDTDAKLRKTMRAGRLTRSKRWAVAYSVENWAEHPETNEAIPTMQSGSLRLAIEQFWRDDEFKEPYEYHLGPRPTAGGGGPP